MEFFLIAALFGIIVEVLQYFLNWGRSFDILDIITNISGSIIGVIIFNRFFKLEHYE